MHFGVPWSIVEHIGSIGAFWSSVRSFNWNLPEFDGALEYMDHVECLGVQEHYGVVRRSCFSQPD